MDKDGMHRELQPLLEDLQARAEANKLPMMSFECELLMCALGPTGDTWRLWQAAHDAGKDQSWGNNELGAALAALRLAITTGLSGLDLRMQKHVATARAALDKAR